MRILRAVHRFKRDGKVSSADVNGPHCGVNRPHRDGQHSAQRGAPTVVTGARAGIERSRQAMNSARGISLAPSVNK